jgi:hypothetical protein
MPCQHHVASNDDLLGDTGPPGQAEATGHLALVAAGLVVGQLGVLCVLGHHATERPDVLQGPTHHPGVGNTPSVIGEDTHPCPRTSHQAELGQLFAGNSLGDSADRLYVDQSGQPAQVQDALGGLRGVGDRSRVGHGQDRGEPTDRRSGRAACDGLGILATGLTQVCVQVNQARQRDQTVGVDGLVDGPQAGGIETADLGDDTVADQQVLTSSAEQVGTLDKEAHATVPSPASRW